MMCRCRLLSITVVLLWTAAPLWAKHEVTINGRVVDDQARPLSDVEVLTIEDVWLHGDMQANVITPVMHTDSDGRFSCTTQVQSERFVKVVAYKPGWTLAWQETLSLSRLDRTHCQLVLTRPTPITGHLVDSQGQPVSNASVTVSPLRNWLGGFYEQPDTHILKYWLTTQTDDQGRFRFELFDAHEHVKFSVLCVGDTFEPVFSPHGQRTVLYPVDQKDFHLVLPDRIRLNGRVLDPSDQPVEGIELVIRPNSQPTSQRSYPYRPLRAVSDENGRFQFEVPPGDHLIEQLNPIPTGRLNKWVARSVPVTLTPGQSPKDIVVRMEKGGITELDAKESGLSSPETRLDVYSDTYASHYHTYTDAQGRARLHIPTGRCEVYISKLGFGSPLKKVMSVLTGRTHRISANIKRPEPVLGEILDSRGQPVSDVLVTLHPFGDRTWTDSKGRFSVRPDSTFTNWGNPYLLTAQDNANHQALSLPIKNKSHPIQATLIPCSTVTGRVLDLQDRPIPAAKVQLILDIPGCLCEVGPEVLTDTQGQYRLEALPPLRQGHSYRLNVEARGFGRKSNYRISFNPDPPRSITLDPIQLPPADQTSTGRVIDLYGKPVPRLFVSVGGWSGKKPSIFQPGRSTITDENGFFTITRICKSPATFQAGFASDPRGTAHVNAQGGDKDLLIRIKPPSQTTTMGRTPATNQPKRIQPRQNQRRNARRNR